jgi:hypothetical protein
MRRAGVAARVTRGAAPVAALVCAGCFDWQSLEAACSRPVGAPDVAVDYVIHLLPEDAGITDASTCADPFWDSVPELRLGTPRPTDNTLDCRFVWQPARTAGVADLIHGCCKVTDTDLRAENDDTTHDLDVFNDDSFEYILTRRPNTRDGTTSKVTINIKASVLDASHNGEDFVRSYEASVVARADRNGTVEPKETINNPMLDMGYNLTWRANVGFAVPAPHVAGCGFMMSDVDGENGARTMWNAYGAEFDDINKAAKWGRCLFSCTPPPLDPASSAVPSSAQ